MTRDVHTPVLDEGYDLVEGEFRGASASPPPPPTPATQTPAATTSPNPDAVADSNPPPPVYTAQVDAVATQLESTLLNHSSDDPSEAHPDESFARHVLNKVKGWAKDKEVLIAVMGMTGAGKTTFISKATGIADLKIGHSLESCTSDISLFTTKIDDITVHLVDTPGFSDTYLSDTEVLELIAEYLAKAYNQDRKLSGIIYLHPISENRMTNSATKNLAMFQKLTGENNLKNVVLATSMWDRVTPEEGERRERELQQKFWNVMLSYNARTMRYLGSPDSAHDIARLLMDNTPFYVQLQEEMGKGKSLRETTAGMQIVREIILMKEQHQREMAEMKDMINRAQEEKNEMATKALQEHYEGLVARLEQTLRDERSMSEGHIRHLEERVHGLENRGGGCQIM
ncbi:hypothetical protein DRE_05166 [Drechslerella stenobrocha 248]|uniref:G domain-containing protein n=1 Tax=Drechslerella stenobrocha 248 TaxID=1043628 RepID=W7I997_9PEZI|nr:hypothetical protein DRE_05166 [Drechslerella stenobrocha 248]